MLDIDEVQTEELSVFQLMQLIPDDIAAEKRVRKHTLARWQSLSKVWLRKHPGSIQSETTTIKGVGLELSDSRGLVKSQDTFDVGRCQTVRSREEGVPRIGV